jgi:hypothetical protein
MANRSRTTKTKEGARTSRPTASALQLELNQFVATHAEGWSHNEWLALLDRLRSLGIQADPEKVGAQLEKTRLAAVLRSKQVPGLGPRRIEALVDRFQTLWSVRHASTEDIRSVVPSAPVVDALEAARR